MDRKDLLFFGATVGVPVAVVAALLLTRKKEGVRFSLTLEATKGGTTVPSPRTYEYPTAMTITVTAIADSGYEFDGWFISGEKVSTDLVYDIYVTENVLLVASFIEIGAPPLIPAYVKPIQNAVAEQWWKVWTELAELTDHFHIGVDFYNSGYAKFKICDVAGNGVPGQTIAVYTDPMPDITDFGHVFLSGSVHTEANPLILTSDGNGVVSVKVDYHWIEPDSDYRDTIAWGGKVYGVCPPFIYWDVGPGPPLHDGYYINRPCAYIKWRRNTLKHPIYRNLNYIHAYWVDNPNLPVWGDAVADCMVKIEGNKEL